MTELALLFIITLGILIAVWKTGFLTTGFSIAGDVVHKSYAWFKAEGEGAWVNLASRLLYRDFYHQTVELEKGWLYAACETHPISTDGFSNADKNELSNLLNTVAASIPEGTRVQVITKITNKASEAISILERQVAQAKDPVWKAMASAEVEQFKWEESENQLKDYKQYVLLGRQAHKGKRFWMKLKGLWSTEPWIDQSESDFSNLMQDVLQSRDLFMRCWSNVGGASRPMEAKEIKDLAYERLNPKRARDHAAPEYDYVNNPAENPREILCMTSAEVKGEKIVWDGEPWTTVTLHKLPLRLNATTMERFTRYSNLDFDLEISSHFEVLNSNDEDEKMETQEKSINRSLEQQRIPNRDEVERGQEVTQVRIITRNSSMKLVDVGFAVSFNAPDEQTLKSRTKAVIAELKRCEGLECSADRHAAMAQHLATLPGHIDKDKRKKRALTREAMALACWTGGPKGLPASETTMVLHRTDGGIYKFNPQSERFSAGMFLICGGTGSGKSTLLAYLGRKLSERGQMGIMLDLNGSFYRLSIAAGGQHLRIIDPKTARGLGVFDIYPREGERFEEKALINGLPRDRVTNVVMVLEQLCLDPNKPDEYSLEQGWISHLQEIFLQVADKKWGSVIRMDDIIRALRLSCHRGKQREYGEKLAERLSLYSSRGPYGHFFNDDEETQVHDSPLTVFDFDGTRNNPRLMQVGTLAINLHLDNFARQKPWLRKYFYVDELKEMTNSRLMTRAIDGSFSTARKNKIQCGAASQHPEHFEREDLKAIATNCETKWLFKMPAEVAMNAFGLPVGVANMLEKLEAKGDGYRDCVLLSPLGVAGIRMRYNYADLRLCSPASTGEKESASLEEAIASIPGEVPERLLRAFKADRLGRRQEHEVEPPVEVVNSHLPVKVEAHTNTVSNGKHKSKETATLNELEALLSELEMTM
jgi:energy-coupling factor transporter ATP-binding protein EcfA2